ncbi:Glyoxalase-like domain protein [Arthrobacter saudimassiliensis]|uniref:Glyoxalase-like domain protein n=1 Tax=Arthrobacter saudimassiliensis TaxID=1461584 RepID=A0A078MUA7_9MICC|nr:Glyoxalase-like domain protein [Arthrobacter saudimassiliensis]
MSYDIQICIDCTDPLAQADWWAETLGWEVEPTDQQFLDGLLARGLITADDLVEHNGVRVFRQGAALHRPNGDGHPRILFQAVPEPKTVKDRIHLDIRLAGGDKDAVRAALEARGATYLWTGSEGPHEWYTMADPEGNEFCIA